MDWLIPEWLLAFSITVFVIDIFFQTEMLYWLGVLATAVYATLRIDVPFKWSVAVFFATLLAVGFLYNLFLRVVIGSQVRRVLQRGAPDEAIASICGAEAKIHIVEGRPMLRWNGDELWPIKNPPANPVEGQSVKVIRLDGGLALIEC